MAIIPNDVGVFVSNVINSKYDIDNPTLENFPTHYDQNGHGGFMAIDSSIQKVSGANSLTGKYELIIPLPRRKVGMMIYDINPEVASFYQCTDAAACSWEEVDFKFRYFYGAAAPTATDIQVGEKWFDTVVGSEYTYLPIADGSTYKAWVDIDHIGEGETFSGYITVALANTYYVNVGGDEMTGSLTADKVFRSSSDVNFEDDEFVTKSFVFANFAESSGGVFTEHITGTSAVFSQGVTATKYNATGNITENTQLVTKKYVDDNTIPGVSFHIDDQVNPFATNVDAISLSGGSNIDIFFDNISTPNRFVISSTLEVADEFVNIDGDIMEGSLTGTDAFFDLVQAGSITMGQTTNLSPASSSVSRIYSSSGILMGGDNTAKGNWLGNNAYLAPQGYVFAGIPNNIPTNWFNADGGTYPFDLKSLNVTGGIHTDRAFRWGNKKGQNTFLDQEFVTKAYVTPDGITGGTGAGFAIIPCSRPNTNKDDYIMVSYIPQTLTVTEWLGGGAGAGQINYFTNEGTVSLPIANYPTINSIVGTVYNNSVIFTMSVKITDINPGSFNYRVQVGRLTDALPNSGDSEITSVLVNFVVTSN